MTLLEGGDNLQGASIIVATLSPALVAANTTAEQIFAVQPMPIPPNRISRAFADVNKPTQQAGLGIVGARVVDGMTIAVTFSNNTAAGITPTPGEVYTCLIAW